MENYLIAFRLSGDRESEWREITATDRGTAQYVYAALLPRPDIHAIELCEWKPGAEGALGHYAPGRCVVLSSRGGPDDEPLGSVEKSRLRNSVRG